MSQDKTGKVMNFVTNSTGDSIFKENKGKQMYFKFFCKPPLVILAIDKVEISENYTC